MDEQSKSDFRTVRGYELHKRIDGQLTPALEDYLEMAFRLCQASASFRVGQLSALLQVRPSSASKMLAKLASLGYVQYEPYEQITLTESGRRLGSYLLYRHDTLTRFLNLLGTSKALEETELIEHTVSPDTVSAIAFLCAFFECSPDTQAAFAKFRKGQPESVF